MNIHVSQAPQPNLLGGQENMVREFKASIFIYPDENIPGTKQYFQIAKTIAGFINAEGGTLWLGVDDGGTAVGVEPDLAILGGGSALPCRGPLDNDCGMEFRGTADQYILKLKELVKAYLGASAEKYISGAQASRVDGKIVVKVPVSKADVGYVAYVYKWLSRENRYSEELYQRVANGTSHLEGFARDKFIRDKCREEFAKQLNLLEKNANGLSKAELVEALKEMQAKTVVGTEVQVEGALTLDDPNFNAIRSPKGFVFDGKHVCDVKTWKDAFGALLVKLNEIDAAKFDGIADEPFFSRWFVEVKPHKKYGDYFKDLLGTAANVRGFVKVGKVHFVNPDYIVQRLLARFGIEPSRVGFRG